MLYNRLYPHFLIAFAICGLAIPGTANSSKKSKNLLYEVNIQHAATPPVLDGTLSKNEWKDAAVIYNFTQKEPIEGAPSSEPTFVLVSYDDTYIYFGIRCFDREPNKIVANEMRRDYDLSENDYFEIIIDTFHDQRNSYYFATNSLGARLDCEIKTEGTHLNWDWDGIWRSAARKDEYGWTAEVAIPFQTLRFDNGEHLTWGINFGRFIPRKREEAFWSPISRDDDFNSSGKYQASKFGTLRGLFNIKHQSRVKIKPYAIGGAEKNFVADNPIDKETDVGLDAKVHITTNLVADLTINTDFAQVESDAEEVNLSRFNLFFPEKRDFFIEGLDVFKVGEQVSSNPFSLLFFSRRIGLHRDVETFELKERPIIGGVKMTGKAGRYEVGLLEVYTEDIEYTNLNNNRFKVPKTNFAAFRIKRDILQRSSIGFMALSKDEVEGGHYNRTFAMDGTFNFDNNINVYGYLAKTKTRGVSGGDLNGFVEASWGSDRYYLRSSFTDIGKNFNPEMGFLQWTDIRKYNLSMTFSPRPKFLNTRQTHFSNDVEYITDHDNELQYRTIQPGIFNVFNNESFVFVGLTNYYDRVPDPGFFLGPALIPGGVYKYNVAGASYSSDLSRKVAGKVRLGAGSFYDGPFYSVTLSSFFHPGKKVSIDLDWNWNRVDVPFPNGEFTTTILAGRLNYSFSPDLFVKTFVQWNDFNKRVVSNILLSYIYRPGSNFYLVYNEEWDTGNGVDVANRTVLAKLTYLFSL
ncbi:carbohydrate binding family 9 domain-containing protein [candidate division KSB1 bacterium]|nr:carbohydrate binding family 9 domain-containing protein [candidate division KSB1 bacterium]